MSIPTSSLWAAGALLAGGCTLASGVDNLTFDLSPPDETGGGGAGTTTASAGGAGGAGGEVGTGGEAPPLEPVGDDFEVGASDPGSNGNTMPGLSATGDGVFMVAWTDIGAPEPDDPFSGIRFDTFTADTCVTCFGRINETKDGSQLTSPGAAVPGGTAALYAWTNSGPTVGGATLRWVGSDGAPIGGEVDLPNGDWIAVGASWAGFTGAPGRVTVAWVEGDADGPGIFSAQLSPGGALMGQTQVNAGDIGVQSRPSVAVDSMGRALVVWVDDGAGIVGRRLDAAGLPQGDDILLGAASGANCAPSAAASADRFMVVFARGDCGDDDFPPGGEVVAVPVAADGSVGDEVSVSPVGDARAPDVAFDGEHFVVVWTDSVPGDGGGGLQRRRLWQSGDLADATPRSVHGSTANDAECTPSVVANASGRVAIAWSRCDAVCHVDRPDDPPCRLRMRYFE